MRLSILILYVFTLTSSAESVEEIVGFRLDPRLVHTIYCHERNTGVTTVVFPSEISGIYAARVDVKFNEKKPSPFLLSFTTGSSYFTIKSLSANNAAGAINVVYQKQVYVIHLKTVKKGHSSVSFIPAKKARPTDNKPRNASTASQLLSMLDKAKAYQLIKKHYPAQADEILYHAPDTVMEYSTHQILLKEVIRFDSKDTIYFHIQIKNKGLNKLEYNPKDFAVNIADKIFYASLSDASGEVPGEGLTTAWFCISGTKAGGRNNLAVKNDWKVLLNMNSLPALPPKKKALEKVFKDPHKSQDKETHLEIIEDIKLEEKKP